MLELDNVNFKKAIASKELKNCEVARLDGSPPPVGGKDMMSPPPTFELKGWPKLAFVHTYNMCSAYSKCALAYNIQYYTACIYS